MSVSNLSAFIEFSRNLLGPLHVKTDSDSLLNYGRDWTRFIDPKASVVCLPATTQQVSALLKEANKLEIPVVPSGGRTGLAGGAVAVSGEIVLSLERLNTIAPVDLLTRTLRVGAGAIHEQVQERCKEHSLMWPLDLASKGSCQIGGNLATNAGGLHVIAYGHARHWVQSIEVVLMSGEILELNGELDKNNTGFDFRNLFIGSEGTLGIITAATLKLLPTVQNKTTLLFACKDIESSLSVLESLKRDKFKLLACEVFTDACLNAVVSEMNFKPPFSTSADFYLLVELEEKSSSEKLEIWVAKTLEQGKVLDGTLAMSESDSRSLWAYRENITESLSHLGLVYKNDLTIPLRRLSEFISTIQKKSHEWYPGCKVFLFGHAGDGNIHVNVVDQKGRSREEFLSLCEKTNEFLFTLIQSLKGSIAAEHGVGLLKKKYLHFSKDPVEIQLMRNVKRVFDPKGLLNPGKIF